jgi:septum formation protein
MAREKIIESTSLNYMTASADVNERTIEKNNSAKSNTELAIILAVAKAEKISKKFRNDLIIAADTFAVLQDGKILHKPKDKKEAISLCMAQSGATIEVITGLCMIYKSKMLKDYSKTKITYTKFQESTIVELLKGDDATIRNSGLGFFSDAPGFTLVKSFRGSYTGAMGLPMEIVRKNIVKLGYDLYE